MKKRWNRVTKLLRMDGSVGERIGTGVFVIGGFVVGLWFGRTLLTFF
jgi:hypothetical protein